MASIECRTSELAVRGKQRKARTDAGHRCTRETTGKGKGENRGKIRTKGTFQTIQEGSINICIDTACLKAEEIALETLNSPMPRFRHRLSTLSIAM
jgi:hypothetical protein